MKLITTEIGKPSEGGEEAQGGSASGTRAVALRGDALEITCGDGSVLRVLEVQPTNKKVMSAKAFANGLRGMDLTWVELEPEEALTA